jgi:hypothetical protein
MTQDKSESNQADRPHSLRRSVLEIPEVSHSQGIRGLIQVQSNQNGKVEKESLGDGQPRRALGKGWFFKL